MEEGECRVAVMRSLPIHWLWADDTEEYPEFHEEEQYDQAKV